MIKNDSIIYLSRSAVDAARWDACIAAAPNGLLYATTWYLDALCDNWDAIIYNDYTAVMPLPWRKNWGVKYVYTPFFIPALGIFSLRQNPLQDALFLEVVAQHFLYCNLDAATTSTNALPAKWKKTERTNYIVSGVSQKNYHRLAKRKIALAKSHVLHIEQGVPAIDVVKAYQQHYVKAHSIIPQKSYNQLTIACAQAPAGTILTLVAHLPQQPVAAFYLLLTDHKNVYSLMGGSTPEGKAAGAFYALTDAAIQLAQEAGKTFRFEGSDVKGIAFFNRQFGAQKIYYEQWQLNQLPWPFSLLKK